jgi:hypothetical protein
MLPFGILRRFDFLAAFAARNANNCLDGTLRYFKESGTLLDDAVYRHYVNAIHAARADQEPAYHNARAG